MNINNKLSANENKFICIASGRQIFYIQMYQWGFEVDDIKWYKMDEVDCMIARELFWYAFDNQNVLLQHHVLLLFIK